MSLHLSLIMISKGVQVHLQDRQVQNISSTL